MAVTILNNSRYKAELSKFKKMLPFFGSSAIILIAMIVGKAFSFIWKILLLRYDVSFLGEIELFSTSLGLVITFSTLAFPAALIRFSLLKKTKAKQYFFHALSRGWKSFLIVSIALWLFSKFGTFLTPNTQLPLLTFLAIVFLSAIHRFSLAYLNGQKRFVEYGLGEYILAPGLKLILLIAILLGFFQKTFLFPHVIWSIILTAMIVIAFTFKNKNKQQTKGLTKKEKKDFLSYSTTLSSSFLTFMIYGALDVYLLQYFFNTTVVGLYAGMLTLINLMDLVFLPFLHTFSAHLSEKKSNQSKIVFTANTASMLVKMGLITGIVLSLLGLFLLPILSKNVLQVSIQLLLIFTIFKTLHLGVVHVYRHYLDFQGEQAYTAKTMFLSLIVKLLLSLALVGNWNLIGLAVANIITDLFHSYLLLRRVHFSR